MLDPTDIAAEDPAITEQAERLRDSIAPLFPDASRIHGGWTLKTRGGYRLDLYVMLFNVRLCESVEDDWYTMGRYWCYPKEQALLAIAAAFTWDMKASSEPIGWIKSWDQRRDGEGEVKARVQ